MERSFLPKFKQLFLLLLILVVGKVSFSQGPLTGIYTIGSTPGYSTLTAAVDSLVANGVSGPVTFNLLTGTYNEQLAIPAIAGVSATNTVTFKGLGDSTKISYSPLSTNLPVIGLNAARHFVFDSLFIEVQGSQGWAINFMNASDSNIVRNCHILLPSGTSDLYGVCALGSVNGSVEGANNANYLLVENNQIEGGAYGISILGDTPYLTGNKIIGNTIVDFGSKGMLLNGNTLMDVVGNTLTSSESDAKQAINIWPVGLSVRILSNTIYLASNTANTRIIQFANAPGGGGAGGDCVIANNMIHYAGSNTSNATCIYIKNTSYVNIYNNTCKVAGAGLRGIWADGAASNVEFINNNIYSTVSGAQLLRKASTTTATSANNNLYSTNSFEVNWGSDYYSLATFQSASGDTTSVSIDPMFVSNTDLHILPSNFNLNDLGTPLAAVIDDIDGDLRDPLTPDIGADEFDVIASDAAITAIDGVTGVCAGPANVYATLENAGLSSLTSAHINWEVSGTLQSPVIFSGSLSSGSDTSILLGSINLVGGVSYDIKVWSSLPNNQPDQFPINDTILITGVQTALSGTFSIGATGNYTTFTDAVNALTNSGVCGPVVFEAQPGTYTEQLAIPTILGVSATNTVTFKGLGDATKISYSPSASNLPVIGLNAAKHFVFDSLYVEVQGSQGWAFNFMNLSDSNTVRNCHITLSGIGTEQKGICAIASVDGSVITGTTANYLLVENNLFESSYMAVHVQGDTPYLEGNKFLGNKFLNFGRMAFNVTGNTKMDIIGNEMNSSESGVDRAINTWPTGSFVNIIGNYVYVNSNMANTRLLQVANAPGGGVAGEPIIIANNMIIYAGSASANASCIYTKNTSYMYLYNNTTMIASGASSKSIWLDATGTDTNVEVKNNNIISYVNGAELLRKHPSITAVSSNNNLYNPYYFSVYWSTGYASLSTFQSGTGDTSSVSIDPMFVSATNLHILPSNSNLNNLGTPIAAITVDIDGDLRDTSTPDIGADEFVLIADDAGITAIDGVLGVCAGAADVYATLANGGIAPLTSATISWEVNGILQSPLSFSGSLITGNDTSILIGAINMVSGTLYDIKVWSSLPNNQADQFALNDTTLITGVQTAMSGTYSIGTTGNYTTFNDAVTALTNFGVCGPVVFEAQPGTYTEQVIVPTIIGVDSINTITFTSQTGDSTSVNLEWDTSSGLMIFTLDHSDYVTIKNITIRSTSTGNSGQNVRLYSCNHINILNNILQGPVLTADGTSAVIISDSGSSSDVLIANNQILNGKNAIYYTAGSGSANENVTIENNIIDGFFSHALYAVWNKNLIFRNNYVHNGQSTSNPLYAVEITNCNEGQKLIGNTINIEANAVVQGIRYITVPAISSNPNLIANNFVSVSGGNGDNYGIVLSSVSNTSLYHNSVNIYGGTNTIGAYVNMPAVGGFGNIRMVNNNFANNAGGMAFYCPDDAMSPGMITYSDYNNYFSTGAVSVQFGVWDASLLADLNLIEPHSKLVNPVYASPTNLHCYSPFLMTSGKPLASVLFDIDGETRDLLHPSIGADEFVLFSVDAGMSAFVGLGVICPGTADIFTTINNFGLVPLTSVTVDWSVNGVAQQTVVVTDTIPVGGSLDVNLGTYSFLSGTVYDLVGSTSLPNGGTDANTVNDGASNLGVQTAAAGTYTIGAIGDFTSIGAAQQFILLYGVCGPVVFNILPGTYDEQVSLVEVTGVDATNTVTWQSSTGNNTDVIIQYGATGTGDNWVWAFDGADHNIVQNITIKSTTSSTYGRVVIFQNTSNYNEVNGNIIESIITTSSNSAVIRSYSDSQDEFNTISGNTIIGGYYGIYWYGSSSNLEEGNKFLNNTVEMYYYYGFYNYYQLANTVHGNYVYQNPGGSVTNYPFYVAYCDGPIVVTNNKVYDDAGSTFYGMRIYYCDATAGAPGLVANNWVYNENTTSTAYGLYLYYSNYMNVYHNSVYLNSGTSSSYGAYIYGSTSSGVYTFMNNSIVNMTGGRALYGTSSIVSSLTSSNNNLYTTGSSLCYFSTDYPTLSDWQNVAPGDVLNTDGSYFGFTDLHSNSLYLDGGGIPVPEVTTDIDGEARDPLTPDIGADEFTLANNDAAITALPGVNGYCPGVSDIVATVSNYGLINMNSVVVNWMVNGVLQTPFSYTATIPVGSSADVVIGTYNLLAGTTYDFTVWSTLPNNSNDPNSGNDSLIVTGVTTAVNGTYIIGATGDFTTFTDAVNFVANNGMCGPVVFNVQSGTYSEQVTVPEIIGLSASNTLTFQSLSGINTDVILQYNASGTGDNWVLSLNGADYVTFQNMTLKANGSGNYGYVVVLEGGADYNTISGCVIQSKDNTSSYSVCVYSTSTSSDNYNTYVGNTMTYGYRSFYLYASSSSPEYGNQLINNICTDYYYYGLYSYYNYDIVVDGNYFYQSTSGSTTNYGIYVYYGDGATRVVNNTVIDDAGSTVYGIRLSYCDPTSSGSGLVANNMVSINGPTGTIYSMYLYYSTDLKCYNNSINILTGGTAYGIYLYSSTTYTGPYDLKNNCVANFDGGRAFYSNNAAVNFTSEHNNWYTTGTSVCYNAAANNYATIADWQVDYPGDVLSVDPEYIAADDLHTASIYLNAAGTPVPEVTTDIDGQLRNTTSPDVGADEFDLALPPVDLALSLLYHYGEVPLAGAADVVHVTVQNVGNNDQYNYPVILNITGANTFVDTVFIPYIPTGAVQIINFTPFVPTSIGLNNIAVSIPNDGDNTNNLLTGYNHATLNTIAYADTSATDGSGANNDANGHIYWTKYYMNGLKAVSSIQAYISDDLNNIGNTVYGAVMDANNNLLALSAPYVLDTVDLSSYITLTFADPSLTLFFNAEYYAGFAQTTPVGANYSPIGYQDEIPMRPGAYFSSSNINGAGFSAYSNDRRWMIKATTTDPAPYDAGCVSIPDPLGDCGLGMETVTIKIQNFGLNAISGNLMAYYQLNNNTVVSQAVTGGIPSGDTLLFSFTTQADFSTSVDSTFNLTAWVVLTGDLNQNNDTAFTTVESLYQPSDPIAVDATVLYGSMATLSVISTDSISWYEDPLSTTPITTGNNLTIGPLYDTATYYAQAGSSGGGGLAITEIDLGANDYIEIQNLTNSTLDATNWIVAISNSYTDINSVNSIYWDLGLFAADEVQIRTDLSSSPDYWGINMFWNPGAPTSFRGWAMILDDQGEIIDFVIWGWSQSDIAVWNPIINTFTVDPSSAWTGDGLMTFPNDFLRRVNYDNNDVTDWTNPTTGDIGFPNFGMNISGSLSSCASAMVPVTAYVVNIPPNDIGVIAAYSPVSGTNLTSTETVSVEINNWGSQAANLFQITYDISGATSSTITELVALTTPIASGTSSTFTFNTPADLSAYGMYYFDVFTQLAGDGFAANDTISFVVENSAPVFCSSGATNSGNEEIVQVDLSNISNYSFPSGSLYSNYNNSVAPGVLVQGNSHPISITSDFAPGNSTQYSCWVEVYVDWNNDGVYTEPQETAFSSAITSSQTISGMLAVPVTASLGNHSMRVVMEQTTSAAGVIPCGYYTYGETEDYQVFVQPPYATDAGAIAILSPNGSLLENTSHPVEVVVYNYGTSTITNMDVVYTVDGLNPVTTAYIGSLPAFSADTISLGNLIVPGGYFELCAYTDLVNDSSALNDATCTTLFADPQYDLEMVSVDAPLGGCALGLEDVTVVFTNNADTVFGNVLLAYFEPGMTAPVTETYNGTLLPGDTASFTFTTQIDLTVTIQTEMTVSAWLSVAGDPIQVNDSAFITFLSDVSPAAPLANDITIWAGTSGTLNVINPDSALYYEWFDASMLSIGTETSYITPVLFDSTTYYVQASSNTFESNDLTTTFAGGNGSTGNMFDITAYSTITIDSFYTNVSSTGTMEVWYRPGTYIGYTSTQAGWTLLGSANVVNPGTNIPALLPVGGLEIPAGETYGIYVTFVTGSVAYTNGNGTNQVYEDNNMKLEGAYGGSYFNLTNTPRIWNGTVFYTAGTPGCESALTPVNANVQYANYDGAVLNITSPVSASNMNNSAVTIDIYNNGLLDFSNFYVQYTLNGGTPVSQLVTATIVPGQVYSFTFTDSASASVFGAYDICASITVTGDGYPANNQYCTVFTNWDGNGESCSTAYPYLVINDPPVYQTTIHPYDRQWWRFELPVDASNVDVSLCGSLFDTKLEVHSDCPASSFLLSSFLGANDNSCGQQSNIHFNALSAGTYYAKVFGYQGEFGDYVLEITGTFADIAIVNFTVSNILCNGAANGSVVASVSPIIPGATLPLTYAWSNGNTGLTLYNLAPGTYSLTITDALGIPQIETVTITEPPALSLTLAGTDVTTLGGNDGAITATVSGGVTPYTFVWSNGAGTQDLNSIFAGVYTLTVFDANGCDLEESFTVNAPLPQGWTVTPTANSHLIIVSQNSNITLDGINAAYGSLIGVFYNQNGTMVCAGWAYWSGMSTSITAYGATPPIDNGYQPGETFTWRLYEASLGVEFGGPACYIASYPNQGTYITGGFSGINCLNAQSIILQPINLPFGWSIWSTYVDPVNPNMVAIFDSIASYVTIVKSGSGQIYWPLYSLNTIGNLVKGQGYQIKMSTPKLLQVQGLLIDPVVNPINIPGGWSIMGYLRTTPMNAVTVMSPIVSQIVIVKSGSGQIYWPLYGLNTIGNMVPGQGYQIKMTSQQTFTFPANTAAPTKSDVIQVHPEKYDKVNNTGHNMSLGILEDAWNVAPQVGDEIGAFNAKGELIGSSVYQDGFNAITIWGDDSQTQDMTEGIANGDVFTLKLWSFNSDTEQELVVNSWLQGNDQYGQDAISVIEKLVVMGEDYDGFRLYQNVPNPFKDVTEISFYIPEASQVRLVVYNTLGEMIEELASARYEEGKHSVAFKTGNLSSGTYFYKIVSDKFTDTKVMNIQ